MFVSLVQPVAILKAVFCITCSLFRFELATIGDQIVLAYSNVGRVIALYVVVIVSLCFPHFEEVSAFSIFTVLLALSLVFSICSL